MKCITMDVLQWYKLGTSNIYYININYNDIIMQVYKNSTYIYVP